jgi:hypothetical protein
MKCTIAARLGPIFPEKSLESELWENSANSLDELLEDAKAAAPLFLEATTLPEKPLYTGGFLFKERASILDKLRHRERPDDGIKKINDALRGTFIAEDKKELLLLIEQFKERLDSYHIPYVFTNLWKKNQLAYGAIHAKLSLPTGTHGRKVLAEVQFHFRQIFERQEEAHALYKLYKNRPLLMPLPSTLPFLLDLLYFQAISQIATH